MKHHPGTPGDLQPRAVLRTRIDQPPEELTTHLLELGSSSLLVLSFRIPEKDLLASLTTAEREIAVLAAGGATNLEIAHRRGVSKNTIAKQIATVFRKVGVTSRFELIALLSGSCASLTT